MICGILHVVIHVAQSATIVAKTTTLEGVKMKPDTESVERLMKKCQIGCGGRNALDTANGLLAECYGTLGALVQDRDALLKMIYDAPAGYLMGNYDGYYIVKERGFLTQEVDGLEALKGRVAFVSLDNIKPRG